MNGIHARGNNWLLEQVLRREWGWDGLIMSDWFGTYSTSESVNAGLDLEMPGPTRWRGELLSFAVVSHKVKPHVLGDRVRNMLNLINKATPAADQMIEGEEGDTPQKRDICREAATKGKSYALIGPAVYSPAFNGGGSAELVPYYVSKPLDATGELVGMENIKTSLGCYNHRFLPLLLENVALPGTAKPGYVIEWFNQDPGLGFTVNPLASDTTEQAQIFFPDYLPDGVPPVYWLRARTVYTAPKTCTIQLGYCVAGKGKLFVDGKEVVDLATSQPPKTMQTPIFNEATMEVIYELDVEEGKQYAMTALVIHDSVSPSGAILSAGGLRIGCCEKIDTQKAIAEAAELAANVDIPILVAGLNSDYETEASARTSLDLPPGTDELISSVMKANPNTIVVTQAGAPITMPWVQDAHTLVHAWYGGQETGNAIADVLLGKVNPSGRLSITFPARVEDNPAFLTFGKVDREIYYGEGVFVGYRYYEKLRTDPLFYFGYGLSYTSFEYQNLQAQSSISLDEDSSFEVCVNVINTGSRGGSEVVQLYVSDKESSVLRPRKELKGFTKVWVKASKKITARITLDKYAFSFWDESRDQWIAEKGSYQVIIGRGADPKAEILRHDLELTEDLAWSGV
ncbi:hypothetical protein ACJ41O_011879 [Fusarium nematophilum]